MSIAKYDVVISGFTLSGCLLAVLLARKGVKVCLLGKQSEEKNTYQLVFYDAFDAFGVEYPQWAFNWLVNKVTGKIIYYPDETKQIQAYQGIVLNRNAMLLDMLKDALQYGVEIKNNLTLSKIDSLQKKITLNNEQEISYAILVCTEYSPHPLSENALFRVTLQVDHLLKGNPGVVEEILFDFGQLLYVPLGQSENLIYYSQKTLDDFKANFSQAISGILEGQTCEDILIHPVKFDLRPIQKPFNNGIMCLGQAGHLFVKPWMIEGALEIIQTRYCSEQIFQFLVFGKQSFLDQINDYSERLIAFSNKKMAKN